jgi:hypothetical protein
MKTCLLPHHEKKAENPPYFQTGKRKETLQERKTKTIGKTFSLRLIIEDSKFIVRLIKRTNTILARRPLVKKKNKKICWSGKFESKEREFLADRFL